MGCTSSKEVVLPAPDAAAGAQKRLQTAALGGLVANAACMSVEWQYDTDKLAALLGDALPDIDVALIGLLARHEVLVHPLP